MFQSPRAPVTDLLTCFFPTVQTMIMMKTNKKDPFLNTWKFQFSYSFMAPLQHIIWKMLKMSHLNFGIFHQFLSY